MSTRANTSRSIEAGNDIPAKDGLGNQMEFKRRFHARVRQAALDFITTKSRKPRRTRP